MSQTSEFSYRTARSGNLVAGLSAAIVIETAALHLLLAPRHRVIAWVLTVLSALAVVWLVRDYQALGRGAVKIEGERMQLTVGRRYDVELPLAAVERVMQPTFRDLPTPGTNEGHDYVNLTRPATPNVLLLLRDPLRVRLPGGRHRMVRRVGMHLDDPAGFVAAVDGEHRSDATHAP